MTIKTNDKVSNYFPITRYARQGCLIAPFLYILQAATMVCTVWGDNQIQGIKLLSVEGDGKIDSTLSMFVDDTHVLNKESST